MTFCFIGGHKFFEAVFLSNKFSRQWKQKLQTHHCFFIVRSHMKLTTNT
jgi:hypothetical protein